MDLSRRELLERAALVIAALPFAGYASSPAVAAVSPDHATLQAFADTILPGRPATTTDLGDEIAAGAIAGVDSTPGAVEADALRLYLDPLIGFDALAPAFLSDLEARALPHGGPFLALGFDARVATCVSGFDFANPARAVWEAAAAVPFTAFCAAAEHATGTRANASGYRVMGYPGAAPSGYGAFSYRRKLSAERTRSGSLG